MALKPKTTRCAICNHAARVQIEDMMRAGATKPELQAIYGARLTAYFIDQHRNEHMRAPAKVDLVEVESDIDRVAASLPATAEEALNEAAAVLWRAIARLEGLAEATRALKVEDSLLRAVAVVATLERAKKEVVRINDDDRVLEIILTTAEPEPGYFDKADPSEDKDATP